MEIGEVRVGAVAAVQNAATAESGYLRGGGLFIISLIFWEGLQHLQSSHSRVTIEESFRGKVVRGGGVFDVQHDPFHC